MVLPGEKNEGTSICTNNNIVSVGGKHGNLYPTSLSLNIDISRMLPHERKEIFAPPEATNCPSLSSSLLESVCMIQQYLPISASLRNFLQANKIPSIPVKLIQVLA